MNPKLAEMVLARQKRRRALADLMKQGITGTMELAERLGVHRRTIRRDKIALQAQWERDQIQSYAAHKDQALRELDKVKAEAWEAWDRSQQDKVTMTTKDNDLVHEETVKREQQVGDAAYLREVKDAIMKQAELNGLKDKDKDGNVQIGSAEQVHVYIPHNWRDPLPPNIAPDPSLKRRGSDLQGLDRNGMDGSDSNTSDTSNVERLESNDNSNEVANVLRARTESNGKDDD